MSSVQGLAHEWLRLDKDETTRKEIQDLVDQNNEDELEKRLRPRISFGTAGLRARMEAGFARMNPLIIIQTSQGLAAHLLATVPSATTRGFVVGYDARHHSADFAKLTAAAFVAKGIKVWWFEELVHTPLVPFAVDYFDAAGGVMVTASHNPAQDNGFKVYGSNGCQIVSPQDAAISAAIQQNLEPLSWDKTLADRGHQLIQPVLGRITAAYYPRVIKAANMPAGALKIPFVYTPMHGVGLPFMTEVASRLNLLDDMIVVQEQAQPDPTFPTVKYPNPEERGALDLALATADAHNIPLVIANDPDADRFAVAEKVDGTWHQLNGNQTGILLAVHLLSLLPPSASPPKYAILSTTPSTTLLAHMATLTHQFSHFETLTGFKHLGNKSLALAAEGYTPLFAFEEALGYMFPAVVNDKDAITAGAVFLAACARWAALGKTPWSMLKDVYETYGYFQSRNTYLVSPSAGVTRACFEEIRARGVPFPETLGGRRISWWRDLTVGYDSGTEDKKPVLPVSRGSEMVTFEVEEGEGEGEGKVRVTMRGSGTEPKIKFYVEARGASEAEAGARAEGVLRDVLEGWFRAGERGLGRAY